MVKRITLAAIATGKSKLIGPALLVISVLFPFVLFAPLLTTRIPLISYNEVILARVAYDLFFVDKFLFVVVFVFGMLIPACKMIFSAACWYLIDASVMRRCGDALSLLSKLSMLDIMLLALFIVAFKGIGIGFIEVKYGLYVYVLLIVTSLGVNLAMTGVYNSRVEQE